MTDYLDAAYKIAGVLALFGVVAQICISRMQKIATFRQLKILEGQVDLLKSQVVDLDDARRGRLGRLSRAVEALFEECSGVQSPPGVTHNEIERLNLARFLAIDASSDVFGFREIRAVQELGGKLNELCIATQDTHREVSNYLIDPDARSSEADRNAVANLISKTYHLAGECNGLMLQHRLGV